MLDDANLTSLLSLPYIGWCGAPDPLYLKTREIVLSEQNPYYLSGCFAAGIGSPHTCLGYIWPMSLAMQAFTTDDENLRENLLETLLKTDGGTVCMHESFDVNAPEHFTRPWFSWANSLFCELLLDCSGEKVKL